MSGITKGEWRAYERETPVGQALYEIHWSDDGECVAEVVYTKEDAQAISAVPELIKELTGLVEKIERNDIDVGVYAEEIKGSRAALKKASGELVGEYEKQSEWYGEVVRICKERGYEEHFFSCRASWIEEHMLKGQEPLEAVDINLHASS